MKLALSAILLAGTVGGAASAATINFSTATPTIYGSSVDFGLFTVTASAVGVGNGGADYVSQSTGGLGVLGAGVLDYSLADVYYIDGKPALSTESLTFSFDYAVNLDSFLLSAFDSNDDYTYSINGGPAVSGNTASNAVGGTYVTTFTISAGGNPFTDGVLGDDEFGLLEFTISSVPVPASFGLLGAALAGLGFAARRRRA